MEQKFIKIVDKYFVNEGKFKLHKKAKTALIVITLVSIIFTGPFGPAILLGLYVGIKQYTKHRLFMINFSDRHGLKFGDLIDIKNLKGRVFDFGHSKKAYNVLEGEYESHPIKIFNYRYVTGRGKHSKTHSYTVCEVEIEKTQFPFIFLQPNSFWDLLSSHFSSKHGDFQISLEQEFSENFNLYCTEDYEIEVLQIFTADLLTYLKEHGNKFSIEFSENKIYFYDNLIITENKDLDELYDVVKKVLDKSGPLLKRLHDDFDSMHEVYGK